MKPEFWTSTPLWAGETAVIAGTGPSLTKEDLEFCKGRAKVLCINTSFQIAPWADGLYFADQRWFEHHAEAVKQFPGLKVTIENSHSVVERDPTIKVMRNDDHRAKTNHGLCTEPDGLRTGRNSGHQGMNLLYHLGVRRILMIGFDLRVVEDKRWWFKEYGWNSGSPNIYKNTFIPRFFSLTVPMKEARIEVINCTIGSALKCWPIVPLHEALLRGAND